MRVAPIEERLADERLEQLVGEADVVIDATDNFTTRHAINRACVRHRKSLVSGAGIRFDGQIAVFDLRQADSPCYHCLFPEHGDQEEMRCAVMGVFAPLVGIIGCAQAAEALKLIMGIGESLNGRLLGIGRIKPPCAFSSLAFPFSPRRSQAPAQARGSSLGA